MQEFPIQDVDLLYGQDPLRLRTVRDYFFTRDFLALALGFSAIVLPSFVGIFERENPVALFSVFVSTKRNLEARPRVTIPSG